MNKKTILKRVSWFLLVLIMLIITIGSASATVITVEDSFNRSDGAIGTATNGNAWSVITGTPLISSNQGYFQGTLNEQANLVIDNVNESNNISFKWKFGTEIQDILLYEGSNLIVNIVHYQNAIKVDNTGWEDMGCDDTEDTWHTFEFVNFDYTAGKFDIICDGSLSDNGGNHWYFKPNNVTTGINKIGFKNRNAVTDLYINELYVLSEGATTTNPDNFSIITNDLYDNTVLNNFSAIVNGTLYETTNGAINTTIPVNISSLINITIISNESGGYFNQTYNNLNVSVNLEAFLFQAVINLTAFEKITNNSLYGNFTINNTMNNTFYLKAGLYNITFNKTGYFNQTQEVNITNLMNATVSISDVYSSILNITGFNAYNNNIITNFSGYIYNSSLGYNESFNSLNNSALINVVNGSYSVYFDATNYSISNNNYQNITINSTYENLTFNLYSNNSILIKIYDLDTSLLITENMTIILSGNSTETTHTTTNGTLFLENLVDGLYNVKVSGPDYSQVTYEVTVAERSTQNLNTYLSKTTLDVILVLSDKITLATIEGASVSMSRLINDTWTVIASKSSDITGRIQFQYQSGVKYRFITSKSGYETKTFYLDPVLFSSYTVTLNPDQTIEYPTTFYDVIVSYDPIVFYENQTNNFTFTISSANGILSNYWINVSYPNGFNYSEELNSYGGAVDFSFLIINASYGDKVIINYGFDTVLGNNQIITRQYDILLTGYINNTLAGSENEDYGFTLFERILIIVLFVSVVSGFVGYITQNSTATLSSALIIYSIFCLIGFLPLWAILLDVFIIIMMIVMRGER